MPDICLAGTGGMLPLKNRYLTGCFIEYSGKAVLIDCGEGMQVALAAADIKISRIEMILITHNHADHVTGLPGLLLSMGNCSREEPLDIYIPESAERVVRNLISVCGHLPFEYRLHKLPDTAAVSFTAEKIDPMLTISTLPLKHSVKCLGYSFLLEKKAVFQPEKAQELEIPVKLWRMLHSGEAVILDDGRTIQPEEVTGDKRPPVKVTYITDTLPIREIVQFANNADLFICEGMYGDTDKKQSMNEKGHMLMQDACRLAKEANVKELWLTHYSPAEKHPENYDKELKKLFPAVLISKDGEKKTL
ncbi:ribonuclease Z [Ruminococcus albus]|uniref:Ribonuclease Z n=1 Tax=Ruminococcus albus (strain ATCC 27210 / DSM 20455 / JCM 14654 / NCDO 2250 / 7) TaxID=697329 RepID=E6UJ23_RUMA7|nr:ribonuclease Z [Ruminococcus albus]ADU22289.1 ribonuclease Z [Ruminococcus albus 7 = DSM 20455]